MLTLPFIQHTPPAVGFPSLVGRTQDGSKPKRIIFCVSPHGFVHPNLEMVPGGSTAGDAFEHDLTSATLSPILTPLDDYKSRLLVLDGVSMNSAIADATPMFQRIFMS